MSDTARTTFKRGDRVKLQDDVEAQFPAQANKRGTVIGFGTKSEYSVRILWDGHKPSSVTSFHMKYIERIFNDKE